MLVDDEQKVRLLTIYTKSRKADISDDEILLILRKEGLIE